MRSPVPRKALDKNGNPADYSRGRDVVDPSMKTRSPVRVDPDQVMFMSSNVWVSPGGVAETVYLA